MKQSKPIHWPLLAGLALGVVMLSSWTLPELVMPAYFYEVSSSGDTSLPRKKIHSNNRDYNQADLDKAMTELDKAMVDLDKNLKIDFSKMQKELKEAMEQVNKIDYEKISKEVQASLKQINLQQTKTEVDKAMHEAQVRLQEVDMKKIQQELNKAQEDLKSQKLAVHIDADKISREVTEGLSKARLGIEKAKKELAELKAFTNQLEKDGLIDKKKGYKIEIRNKKLIINGKEQPKEVNEKYQKYLDKEDFSISSDGEGTASV